MNFKDKLKQAAGDLMEQFDLNDLDLNDLLSEDFIKENTNLDSIRDFIEKSGFDIDNLSDLKDVPRKKVNDFISSVSDFDSLGELLKKALDR